MAYTARFRGIDANPHQDVATIKVVYDAITDLPERGATVTVTGLPPGTWYCDEVQIQPINPPPAATITVRRPGRVWTWTGLAPIAQIGSYDLYASTKSDGTTGNKRGYWNHFTNWPSGSNWAPGSAAANLGPLNTWEIEFVAAADYAAAWHNKVNGTWASGLTPPVATAGVWWCRAIRSQKEQYATLSGGTATVYRHWATFWQAPIVSATQMTWNRSTW